MNGDLVRVYTTPHKRFCFALDLKNELEIIDEYLKIHTTEGFWPEIGQGIKEAGFELMDIYLVDNRLFMICEMPVEVDLEKAWQQMGTYEKQEEWSKLTLHLQQALPGHKLEWIPMKRVFSIPE